MTIWTFLWMSLCACNRGSVHVYILLDVGQVARLMPAIDLPIPRLQGWVFLPALSCGAKGHAFLASAYAVLHVNRERTQRIAGRFTGSLELQQWRGDDRRGSKASVVRIRRRPPARSLDHPPTPTLLHCIVDYADHAPANIDHHWKANSSPIRRG